MPQDPQDHDIASHTNKTYPSRGQIFSLLIAALKQYKGVLEKCNSYLLRNGLIYAQMNIAVFNTLLENPNNATFFIQNLIKQTDVAIQKQDEPVVSAISFIALVMIIGGFFALNSGFGIPLIVLGGVIGTYFNMDRPSIESIKITDVDSTIFKSTLRNTFYYQKPADEHIPIYQQEFTADALSFS
jgi:hypothetical protein